jgi:hypothetical protein
MMSVAEQTLILLYKPKSRDLGQLEKVSKDLGCALQTCENVQTFQNLVKEGRILAIIVDLGSEAVAEETKSEFIRETSDLFWPEDAGIVLIYRTEGSTPAIWTGDKDPRFIRLALNSAQFIFGDKDWSRTAQRISECKNQKDQVFPRLKVDVRVDQNQSGYFSNEAKLLLRGAFREMSAVQVSFRKQGLSGSIGFMIQPFDREGHKASLKYFGKLYRDDSKANNDYNNWDALVRKTMSSLHYPSYDVGRSCKGKAFSLWVTELFEGPGNEVITFRDMVRSESYSVEQVCNFLHSALRVLDQYWKATFREWATSLTDEYLPAKRWKEERQRTLESELIAGFGLGVGWEQPPEERLAKHIHPNVVKGKNIKRCHGDFHGDNIIPRCFEDKLIPAFIDFSNAHPSKHYLTDHVALETDLIVNGLDTANIADFLELLRFDTIFDLDVLQDRPKLFQKIFHLIVILRADAKETYGADEVEYLSAALHKTLNLLSYGNYPPAEYERAIQYGRLLIKRLKSILN